MAPRARALVAGAASKGTAVAAHWFPHGRWRCRRCRCDSCRAVYGPWGNGDATVTSNGTPQFLCLHASLMAALKGDGGRCRRRQTVRAVTQLPTNHGLSAGELANGAWWVCLESNPLTWMTFCVLLEKERRALRADEWGCSWITASAGGAD